MPFVVKNPRGDYLQDSACLLTPDAPNGGPGRFGPRSTAYVFQTQRDATVARFGLLGPGRNAITEKA